MERSFAHCYDTGGMRRTHLRKHTNILKRQLVHMAGFNLSLIFHRLLGAGTPRERKNRAGACFCFLWPVQPLLEPYPALLENHGGFTGQRDSQTSSSGTVPAVPENCYLHHGLLKRKIGTERKPAMAGEIVDRREFLKQAVGAVGAARLAEPKHSLALAKEPQSEKEQSRVEHNVSYAEAPNEKQECTAPPGRGCLNKRWVRWPALPSLPPIRLTSEPPCSTESHGSVVATWGGWKASRGRLEEALCSNAGDTCHQR